MAPLLQLFSKPVAAALGVSAGNEPSASKRPKLDHHTSSRSGVPEENIESLDQLKLSLPRLDDAMRHKTAVLMLEGLHKALIEGADGDAARTAADIEQAIFLQNGGVNANYKTKVRSLAFNMKDARNPDLRARVLEGDISGHVLVTLSSDELASNERRKENKEIRQHALREANPAGLKKATTDAFQYVLRFVQLYKLHSTDAVTRLLQVWEMQTKEMRLLCKQSAFAAVCDEAILITKCC